MVPPCSAVGGASVEKLLRGGGIGQAYLQFPCRLQGKVEILLVKLDPEARIEGPGDHPLAMNLKNPGTCDPADQRLSHSRWIGAGLGGEQQRFRDSLYGKRYDDLIGNFGRLAVAEAADQGDV